MGPGCSECHEALTEALSPAKLSWPAVEEQCRQEKTRHNYNEYRLRRAGKWHRQAWTIFVWEAWVHQEILSRPHVRNVGAPV